MRKQGRLVAHKVQGVGHQRAVERRQLDRMSKVGLDGMERRAWCGLHQSLALPRDRFAITIHGVDCALRPEQLA